MYERINVVGTSGSGKSTIAKMISKKLNIPYIELDALFWGPNWSMLSDEKLNRVLSEKLSGEKWVLDGNYNRTIPIKWKDVQTVIWVDMPFSITFYQAVKRAFKRSLFRIELWPGTGNRETFKKSFFSRNSIILWTVKTYGDMKKRYKSYMNDEKYSHIKFIHLRSRWKIKRFIKNLGK